jgi:phage-related protein
VTTPEQPRVANVCWEGDSWKVLKTWPKGIQWDFGNSLREMQYGRPAKLNVRPMQSIGPGVFELKDADEKNWYRMVYLARVQDTIYVLDCFQKNTAKTERNDLNTARSRLSAVRRDLQEKTRDEKRNSKK